MYKQHNLFKTFLTIITFILLPNFSFGQVFTIETFSTYNYVNSFTDTGDSIWFGTDAGVAIFRKSTNDFSFLTNCNSGLGDNSVTALAWDSVGRIWVGTQFSGLFFFDGVNWTVYNAANSPLNCDSIRRLKLDNIGNLWIAADVLYKFDGTTWMVYPHVQSIPLTGINSLAIDQANQLWVGTTDNGLLKFDGTNWDHYSSASTGIATFDEIQKVYCDYSGQVWVVSHYTLFILNLGQFDTVAAPGYIQLHPTDIVSDTLGNLWIENVNDTLIKYDGNTWTIFGPSSFTFLKSGSRFVFIDNEQNVWLNNYNLGLARFDGDTMISYNLNTTIPENHVNAIYITNDSNAYIGTKLGLCHKAGSQWGNFLNVNGTFIFNVMDIEKEPGTFWVISSNDILRFDGDSAWTVCWPMIFSPPSYTTIFIDHAGNKWFGTFGGEVMKYDNSLIYLFNNLFTNNNFGSNTIYDFNQNINGDILIATRLQGLVSFDGINFTSIANLNSGLPSNEIMCIARNPLSGKFWLGSREGLVELLSPVPNIYTVTNSGLPGNAITKVLFDSQYNLWVGTEKNGLARYDMNTWTSFTMANSCLPGNSISCIKEGPGHSIWVGTDNGLAIITEEIVTYANENHDAGLHEKQLSIFPNPANKGIMVNFSINNTGGKLIISNLTGNEIISYYIEPGNESMEVNTTDLPNGMYFLQLITKQGVATTKLIISH